VHGLQRQRVVSGRGAHDAAAHGDRAVKLSSPVIGSATPSAVIVGGSTSGVPG
jgi:hypothetical protein